jgi:hypothetical protein
MRLRHKNFGSRAGACWRQIFLITLMPWFMKYRVLHEQRSKESLVDQAHEKEVQHKEDMDTGEIINEEMKAAGGGMKDAGIQGAQFVVDVGRAAVIDAPTLAVNRGRSVVNLVIPPSTTSL